MGELYSLDLHRQHNPIETLSVQDLSPSFLSFAIYAFAKIKSLPSVAPYNDKALILKAWCGIGCIARDETDASTYAFDKACCDGKSSQGLTCIGGSKSQSVCTQA